MADNTVLDAGAGGDTIASDDIGGVKFQRVKLIYGADGVNSGDVAAANPLPATVSGVAAHDAASSGNPVLLGGYAKAAAPTDASADGDAVNLWALRNGALCINLTAAGALIPGDAANGLDIDVTRSALPSGASTAAKQPALGTAGTASTDVITVQGIASMTPVLATLSGTNNIATVTTVTTVSAVTEITNALPAGTNAIGKLAANSGVDIGDVDVTSIIPGTGATNLGKAIDTATGATDTGVLVLATRDDALSALTPVEGDNVQLRVDANGALWVGVSGTVAVSNAGLTELAAAINASSQMDVNIAANGIGLATSAKQDTIIGHVDGVETLLGTIDTDTGNIATSVGVMDDWDNGASDGCSVSGDVAHDSADAGEPVKIGAKAETSPKGITLVADADRTDLLADADGMLMVKLGTSGADHVSEAVSNTDGNSTAFTNFAAVASTKAAITSITVFRTDSGTSMAYVDFRDGTAGAVLYRVPLPPAGGCVISLAGQPIFKTSANTALAYDVSSALTTVYISVTGYYTKV
jgi:hypothetical protein